MSEEHFAVLTFSNDLEQVTFSLSHIRFQLLWINVFTSLHSHLDLQVVPTPSILITSDKHPWSMPYFNLKQNVFHVAAQATGKYLLFSGAQWEAC